MPAEPKTTFNVGRIGGGTSVNSIPFEAWMEVDMRSADPASLQSLDAKFHKAVDDAVAAENVRWNSRALTRRQDAGRQPPGRPRRRRRRQSSQAAVSVTKALGFPVTLDEGSTDANYPA